jgi:cytochrome c-type biogenesis protein CcmF
LLGTFLVRSGVLSTVHAFAQDAERGVYLLAITGLFILLAIGVGIKGIKQDQAQPLLMGVNLPSLISIKVYLFVVLTVTLLMGTLYPLLMEVVNGPAVSVGGPYFEKTFVPVGLFILILMGFAPFVKWHHEPVIRVLRRSQWGIFLLLSAVLAILLVDNLRSLALWALIISFWLMLMTIGGRCISLRAWRWQAFFSGIACSGMVLAHIGCALMIIGMAGDQLGRSEEVVALKKGEAISFKGYTIKLIDITYRREATYIAEEAQIEVVKPGHRPVLLYPEKRFYPSFEALTTKTALMLENFSVLYLALGGVLPEDRWTLRLYYHPQVLWIWLGAAIMAVGGFQAWRKRRKKQHRIS